MCGLGRAARRSMMRTLMVVSLACVAVAMFAAPMAKAAAEPLLVPATEMDEAATSLEVFMRVDATADEIAAVEEQIRGTAAVRRYAHLSKADALVEFRRLFRNDPKLIATTRAADLPESFRMELADAAQATAVAASFRAQAGVEQARVPKRYTLNDARQLIRDCRTTDRLDIEVFMVLGATGSQVNAVAAAVRVQPGMTGVTVLSKADAYREFRKLFAHKPKLRDSVTAADLPQSIRAKVVGHEVDPATMGFFQSLPGVDSVSNTGEVCGPLRDLLARGITPDRLAHAMVDWVLGIPA